MCVLIFCTAFVWNIFHHKKNWTRYDKICAMVFMYSTGYSCLILMKLEVSGQSFEKYSDIKFHENPSSGSWVVHADRRTDKHDEGNSWFSQFCERANKLSPTFPPDLPPLCSTVINTCNNLSPTFPPDLPPLCSTVINTTNNLSPTFPPDLPPLCSTVINTTNKLSPTFPPDLPPLCSTVMNTTNITSPINYRSSTKLYITNSALLSLLTRNK